VGGTAIAVLEDLDTDNDRVGCGLWERPQVAVDQALAAVRATLGQLRDRPCRDVEADQVEITVDERQVVAAVAAADVEAGGAEQSICTAGGENVGDERQRRLVAVAAGRVLGVPGLRRVVYVIGHRILIVIGSGDGSHGRR